MSFQTDLFHSFPIVGILRGCADDLISPLTTACADAGLANLEITMNTPNATGQIRAATVAANGRMNIGAGTVTSAELLDKALEAGASYIITPDVNLEVMELCLEHNVPVFPGAFTPTEIHQAWQLGAFAVKLFPANVLGPEFVKSLRGPFADIPLMATGGVGLENIEDYLKAGTNAFGIGSPLFQKDRIESKDWDWMSGQIREFRGFFPANS
ncbi:bifunctional 4-hydroxy-2-oxoglutarate aldolase/2-dehydro-3-deoxy-phosphogluconate aldolase [Verrucomicrobia bacterium]|nr:bifunctional 4-hydroxy-2-oxoglutarate aldolase/2-dehydro-3-deoxy-phosphogluconate aldolase [Verrucomicrobiota bacterium]